MSLELSARFVDQDYCRLCLSSIYELHDLFPKGSNETNPVLMSKISLLGEIILIPTEELNARICSRCIQQLEDFDSFRRRCKDSDRQIRKIRSFQKWKENESPSGNTSSGTATASKNAPANGPEQIKFGGIFDLMLYGEYFSTAMREYCMLFDGCVYRKESLLVWRCELENCPCQLLIENNYSKCWIYGIHNHDKVTNDQRKFFRMDQRVVAFLNKLRDQIDGTCDKVQEQSMQNFASGTQQSAASNPEATEIQYSTEGDRPSILVNYHRYYKEAVNSEITPAQICWRCTDKNCLGMIITTTDLRTYRMQKGHNHALKPVNDALSFRMDLPVKVAALPMTCTQPSASTPARIQSPTVGASMSKLPPAPNSTLPESTSSLNNSSDRQSVSTVTETHPTKQSEPNDTLNVNSSIMTFYKDNRNYYYLYHLQYLYLREICYSNFTNTGILWKCMVKKCPSTMIVLTGNKNATGSGHNHEPLTFPLYTMTQVASTEAMTRPTIVSDISFYKCVAKGLYVLYKQFLYDIITFLPTGVIIWKCRRMGCDGQLRSGMQFEHVTVEKSHNHGPMQSVAVNVEGYLTIDQALKVLREKSQKSPLFQLQQMQVRVKKRISTEKPSKCSQSDVKLRRKSTIC